MLGYYWLLAFSLLFSGRAMASLLEDGEDFSNNLASDLAPILALFGERVTTQFMSESTGWADCIILAMAPIGIITIMVNAIRVGGYRWLRAVIGRGRENIAAAELEVMSSTSREVCELWNGKTVVRCPGTADISELICIYPKHGKSDLNSVTIMDIQDATLTSRNTAPHTCFLRIRTKPLEQFRLYLRGLSDRVRQRILSLILTPRSQRLTSSDEESSGAAESDSQTTQSSSMSQSSCSSLERTSSHTNDASLQEAQQLDETSRPELLKEPENGIIIVRNSKNLAPNISLNRQIDSRRWHLWALAAIAVMIQSGVVIFFGFVTEYRTLHFDKDAAGMLICAHVVDSGSTEEVHEVDSVKGTTAVAIIWLQRQKTVSDQYFQSAAIYPQGERYYACTSKRAIEDDDDDSFNQADPKIENAKRKGPGQRLKVLTAIGTLLSVLGIGGQFTGLRGMHWTASVTQLGAVVLMTVFRALIRRHLDQGIKHKNLEAGFELEWFVQTLSNLKTAPWLPLVDKKSTGQFSPGASHTMSGEIGICEIEQTTQRRFWMLQTWSMTGMQATSVNTEAPDEQPEKEDKKRCHRISELSTAKSILDIRRSLGELYKWTSPIAAEAHALSRAIEVMIDCFGPFLEDTFPAASSYTWSMTVRTEDSGQSLQNIDFHIYKENQRWKARIDELDAALSLWLYSSDAKHEKITTAQYPSGDDRWMRDAEVRDRCLRILGPSTPGLVQDLDWWMPNSREGIWAAEMRKSSGEKEKSTSRLGENQFEIQDARIGRSGQQWCHFDSDASVISFVKDQKALDVREWTCNHLSIERLRGNQGKDVAVLPLVMESQETLEKLYMKELFATFVWILVGSLKPSSVSKAWKAAITPSIARGPESWQNFTLRSEELSHLVQSIVKLGFWTEREVYSSLIPPLSHSNNLPRLDSVVNLACNVAAVAERSLDWTSSAKAYEWLFGIARKFSPTRYIHYKYTAALMRFEARMQRPHLRCFGSQRDDESETWDLTEARSKTMEMLLAADGKDGPLQKRLETFLDIHKHMTRYTSSRTSERNSIYAYADDPLRYQEAKVESPMVAIYDHSFQEDDSHDIFNRTALHHAVQSNFEGYEFLQNMVMQWLNSNGILQDRTSLQFDMHNHAKSLEAEIHEICEADNNSFEWPQNCSVALLEPVIQFTEIIRSGKDINAQDLDRWTPLHYVCHRRDLQPQPALGQNMQDDDYKKFKGRLAEWRANILISKGAYINAQGLDGVTPLHCAAMSSSLSLIKLLIKAKANVTIANVEGHTPLHLAATMGDSNIISTLIRSGSDIEAKDIAGRTPLHLAAMHDKIQSVRVLQSEGAKTDPKDFGGRSLLHLAGLYNKTSAIKFLLQRHTSAEGRKLGDGNLKDHDGCTPLHLAALFDSLDAVKLLLAHRNTGLGELLNERDNEGRTAIHLAAFSNASRVMQVLMEEYAAQYARSSWPPRDMTGATPFHLAAQQNSVQAIHEMLEAIKCPCLFGEGSAMNESCSCTSTTNGSCSCRAASSKNGLCPCREDPGIERLCRCREAFRNILKLEDYNGFGAFAWAIQNESKSAVQAFLDIDDDHLRKGFLNGVVWDGKIPVLYAIEREERSEEMAILLIENGADTNAAAILSSGSLLHLAIAKDMKRLAEVLFHQTNDWQELLARVDDQGRTPAGVAKERGDAAQWFDEIQKRAETSNRSVAAEASEALV